MNIFIISLGKRPRSETIMPEGMRFLRLWVHTAKGSPLCLVELVGGPSCTGMGGGQGSWWAEVGNEADLARIPLSRGLSSRLLPCPQSPGRQVIERAGKEPRELGIEHLGAAQKSDWRRRKSSGDMKSETTSQSS